MKTRDQDHYFKRHLDENGFQAKMNGKKFYIHHNPIHHNYAIDYDAYDHSSYSTLFGDLKTALERTEVLTWYGGKSEMVEYHDKFKNQVWKTEPFFIENTNE